MSGGAEGLLFSHKKAQKTEEGFAREVAIKRQRREIRKPGASKRQRREIWSQGQAWSAAERVAPGDGELRKREHWKCEIPTSIIPLFQSFTAIAGVYQGRRASRCSALALAFIFRAFGAQFRPFVQATEGISH